MTLKFRFIGHCFDPKENHDKVWGVIFIEDQDAYHAKCLTFWGRRGKKLQTLASVDDWTLTKLIRAKESKGYTEVDYQRLNQVYPEFQTDLEKTAMWAILMA